jgi:hypothetical protein
LLTASCMSTFLRCQRMFYWRYEIGLKPVRNSHALRFGSAWHVAMECRWQGMSYEDALAQAVAKADTFEEIDVATLAAMLAGYYARYAGENEIIKSLFHEQEFRFPLVGSRTFDVAGKIDGLGLTVFGDEALVEHKTTSEGIEADSPYWNVLRFNSQIYQYVGASRVFGWNPTKIIYDVVKKPGIRPLSNVPTLDEAGLKIVLGADGARVFKKDGSPYQTANKEKGEVVQGAPETPDQYGARLMADVTERPDYYFARRDVPILDGDIQEFEIQRLNVSRQIIALRATARRAVRPEHAFARNCGKMTCGVCDFSAFCMQNLAVDPASPPAGYVIGDKHAELSQVGDSIG